MGKHLVLVGGGHAHMTVMLNLNAYIRRGHTVTLVNSAPFHYYSGMGPGMLSGIYSPEEIRFHVKKMVEDRGAAFVEGHVEQVEANNRLLRLASGESINYDVVSFNTGSGVPVDRIDGVTGEMVPVKPIINLLKARQRVMNQLQNGQPHLVVVGGGAAGLEITGNLHRLVEDQGGVARITLVAGKRFLSPFPEKVRRLALASFSSRQIEVVEGARVTRFDKGKAFLDDGRDIPYDLVFLALGVTPSPLFHRSGLPTYDDGGLLVNDYLQCIEHDNIFGGGDCISLQGRPLDKVGVYAVRQNPVLFQNLLAALDDGEMTRFEPQADYLGRLAFYMKDYIDRKFMKTFQVSGEQSG
jgi:NADH dehydrogenase FAD-containing subunit